MKEASEAQEQFAVIEWVHLMHLEHIVIHIPNGGKLSPMQGAKLKKLGQRKGCSDLFIVRSSGWFKGLFLEMKSKKGRVSPEQKQFLADMKAEGYDTAICYGADEAISCIKNYLTGSSQIIYHQPPNCS